MWITTYRFCWRKQVKSKIYLFFVEFISVSCTHVLVLGIQDLQPKAEMVLQNIFAVLLVKLVGNMPMSTVLSDSHYYFCKVYYIYIYIYISKCTTKF